MRRFNPDAFTPLTINRTTAVVHLTRGKHALIDTADWPRVSRHRWHLMPTNSGSFYAIRTYRVAGTQKCASELLHRLICEAAEVDHRNGNPLDNRRSNLRPATRQENMRNKRRRRSAKNPYRGVQPHRNSWVARIGHDYQLLYIGCFPTPDAAALAYDAEAKKLHGEFASLNFPEPVTT